MKKFILPILLFIVLIPFIVNASEIVTLNDFETVEQSQNIISDSKMNLIRVGNKDNNEYILKTDKDNNILWEKKLNNDTYANIKGLTTDIYDNVYVSIYKKVEVNKIGEINFSNETATKSFIIKYDKDGNKLYEKEICNNSELISKYEITDLQYINGYIYASGTETINIEFVDFDIYNEGDSFSYVKYANYKGKSTNVIMKLNMDGTPIWEKNYGSEEEENFSYIVEGRDTATINYSTFKRKKYYVRSDSNDNIYVLKVGNNDIRYANNYGDLYEGPIITKLSNNGQIIYSNELNSRFYSTDFIIENDNIILVGKQYNEFIPPDKYLSYSEYNRLSDTEKIEYDKKKNPSYVPNIKIYNINGKEINNILFDKYDRSLFHTIIPFGDKYIAQFCSYNNEKNMHECYDTIINKDKNKIVAKSDIIYQYNGVEFNKSYTLEEDILNYENGEYFILATTNDSWTNTHVLINKLYTSYAVNIEENKNTKKFIIEVNDSSAVVYEDIVVFRIEPEEGFELEKIEIVDENNNNITYKKTNNKNEYEFTMPASDVVIIPTYRKIESINVPDTLKNSNTGTGISIIIIVMLLISSITYIIFKRKKNYIMK